MNRKIKGLSEKEVIENRNKYGTNDINSKSNNSFISLLISALKDPIIKILLIALGIKVIFLFKDFDWYETIGIMLAIFIATTISTLSEYGSEKAFVKMQEEASKTRCRVMRDGKIIEIKIDDVVVSDIVVLSSGDKVPADGVIISGEVSVDESSLSGESREIYKEEITNFNNVPNEKNKLYRGTTIYSKEAFMQVAKVGKDTVYGKIASELQEKKPDSPLKIRLNHLAGIISKIGYISSFLVSFSYLFSVIVLKNNFDMTRIMAVITNYPYILNHLLYALTLCVTIIVVAVPEGLPMMITLVLSSNMKKMLKNNVLVRKLTGIETAGSINILFTDKTGTLTCGNLEVTSFINGDLKEYKTIADFSNNKYFDIVKKSLIYNNSSTYDFEKKEIIGGNITDKSLMNFIKESRNPNIKIEKSIPFDSKNKYSITRIREDNKYWNLVKGSPEKLFDKCQYYYDSLGNKVKFSDKSKLNQKIEQVTKRGIRVLLLGVNETEIFDNINELVLVGIVFIKDEVRKEAKTGIELVKGANIQTVMITGDNKDTAISIGREVGLIEGENDLVLTSGELSRMSDEEVMKILPKLRIVARSLPSDKSRLVRLAQSMNLVVGMTGDGVNDAPALKRADVGFAFGSGTEVSKEASDIVILDDNFLSISKAILFGRTIFKSIRKFIIVQLTINMCAILLSIIGPFLNIETPVTVIQMLWINMVMDTLAGLAFAYEPPILEYMKEKPKKKDESIINKYMISEILFTGLYSAILCLCFLKVPQIRNLFRSSIDDIYLMTAFFGLFIFIDIFNSLNARTSRLNLLANILDNKVFIGIMSFITIVQIFLIYFGGELFRTSGLTLKEFVIMLLFALTVIPVDFIRKVIYKRKNPDMGV